MRKIKFEKQKLPNIESWGFPFIYILTKIYTNEHTNLGLSTLLFFLNVVKNSNFFSSYLIEAFLLFHMYLILFRVFKISVRFWHTIRHYERAI